MDFGDIISSIGKIVPTIATALGGPLAGGAIKLLTGALGISGDSKVEDIQAAIAGATPDQLLALKKADQDFQIQIQSMGYKDIETANAQIVQAAADVNKTIQVEATSEHWVTYSWRPFIGFCVGTAFLMLTLTIGICYCQAIFYGHVDTLQYIPGMVASMAAIFGLVTPILGIAAFFRGKKQLAEASTNGNSQPTQ